MIQLTSTPFLFRYCMHVELGLEESRIRYEAGDHVAIYPTNDLQLVNKIGQLLEIDLDLDSKNCI